MTHPFLSGQTPRILAHRGFVPPDAEGIVENYCHLSADGTVILFHDDDLSRVTGDPRKVSDVGDRELEDLMAERGGLITLAQALDAFPTLRFNLDVKADAAAEAVGRVVGPFADRVLLTSFDDGRRRRALAAAIAAGGTPATSAGSVRTAAILVAVATRLPLLIRRAFRGLDALQVPERRGPLRVVTPAVIRWAHRCGVEVHVWTVNDAADMRRLLARGVDGLVTDRADRALHVLSGRP